MSREVCYSSFTFSGTVSLTLAKEAGLDCERATQFLSGSSAFQEALMRLLKGHPLHKAGETALALPYTREEDIDFQKQFEIFDQAIRYVYFQLQILEWKTLEAHEFHITYTRTYVGTFGL